jgi:hypothetical protein
MMTTMAPPTSQRRRELGRDGSIASLMGAMGDDTPEHHSETAFRREERKNLCPRRAVR